MHIITKKEILYDGEWGVDLLLDLLSSGGVSYERAKMLQKNNAFDRRDILGPGVNLYRCLNKLSDSKNSNDYAKGIYLVMFGVLNNENNTLVYNYIYYPHLFTDFLLACFLVILIRGRK